jgi:hypothetical protein
MIIDDSICRNLSEILCHRHPTRQVDGGQVAPGLLLLFNDFLIFGSTFSGNFLKNGMSYNHLAKQEKLFPLLKRRVPGLFSEN